ncbi:MAG TPA: hypothetical protein VD902_16500, partial [Symbiobacteriaceae bacterium]|nr:hypothetical protein [Symbiobacteriaceae bacterium]
GFITIAYHPLLDAVASHYEMYPEEGAAVHRELAEYFRAKPTSLRAAHKQLQHGCRAQDWDFVYKLLIDLDFLQAAWRGDEALVRECWGHLCERGVDPASTYLMVLQAPLEHEAALPFVATLLGEFGHPDEAIFLWNVIAGLAEREQVE